MKQKKLMCRGMLMSYTVKNSVIVISILLAIALVLFLITNSMVVTSWPDQEILDYCKKQYSRIRIQGVMDELRDQGRLNLMYKVAEECNGIDGGDPFVFIIEDMHHDDAEEAIYEALKANNYRGAILLSLTDLRDRPNSKAALFLRNKCSNPNELIKETARMEKTDLLVEMLAQLIRLDQVDGKNDYQRAINKNYDSIVIDEIMKKKVA